MPRIFAIGDLHLSLSVENKAMDVFGPGWANHVARLKEGWQDTVGEEDLVLVPGDISWGLRLEEALADLDFIHGLKGTKILLRGNHDYWWTGYSKVKSILPPSVKAVQNGALLWNGVIVGGTRGWNTPLSPDFSESKDRKIFEREKLRLGLSHGRYGRTAAGGHTPLSALQRKGGAYGLCGYASRPRGGPCGLRPPPRPVLPGKLRGGT